MKKKGAGCRGVGWSEKEEEGRGLIRLEQDPFVPGSFLFVARFANSGKFARKSRVLKRNKENKRKKKKKKEKERKKERKKEKEEKGREKAFSLSPSPPPPLLL